MMSVYFTLCTLQLLPLTYPDSSSMTGLINGGLSGMIYTYIGGTFGMSCAILAMAEMASM